MGGMEKKSNIPNKGGTIVLGSPDSFFFKHHLPGEDLAQRDPISSNQEQNRKHHQPFSNSMSEGKSPNNLGPRIGLQRQLSIKVYDRENREVVHAECSYVQLKKPSRGRKLSTAKVSDELPNYMKPTSSFDTRKDQLQALDPSTKKTLPKETSLVEVCRYTYCAFHDHKREQVARVKTLSERRQVLKNQSEMKPKKLASLRKIGPGKSQEELSARSKSKTKVGSDFFVEICAEAHEGGSGVKVDKEDTINAISVRGDDSGIYESCPVGCSEDDHNSKFTADVECDQQVEDEEDKPQMSLQEGENNASMSFQSSGMDSDGEDSYPEDVWGNFTIEKYGNDAELSHESEEGSTESDKHPYDTNIISENFEEVNGKAEDFSSLSQVQLSDSSKGLIEAQQGTQEANDIKLETHFFDCFYYVSSDESSKNNYERLENEQHEDTAETKEGISTPLLEDCTEVTYEKSTYHIEGRTSTHDMKGMRKFNPRAPKFLPEELEQEADNVDLRHQMMNERRAVEEWMIDYALQQAVKRLAPARKTKVQLLVEAFETVIPLPMCEKTLKLPSCGNWAISNQFERKSFIVKKVKLNTVQLHATPRLVG